MTTTAPIIHVAAEGSRTLAPHRGCLARGLFVWLLVWFAVYATTASFWAAVIIAGLTAVVLTGVDETVARSRSERAVRPPATMVTSHLR